MEYLPLDIWADLLEDQGENISALRAWLEIGVKSQGNIGIRGAEQPSYGNGYFSDYNWLGNGYGGFYGNGEVADWGNSCDWF